MLLASLALLATTIQYNFPLDQPRTFDVAVQFEGFMPLFGGQPDSDVQVKMQLEATGRQPDSSGNRQVTSEIKQAQVLMNGNELPLDPGNLTRFFPRTTISMSPYGKVLKTDAPDRRLPVQLPGLDAKRLPDITYLPIEFPEQPLVEGEAFSYRKKFGDSDVLYTITPEKISEESVDLDVQIKQQYSTFEDEYGNAVQEQALARTRIDTVVTGKGKAQFDRSRGLVSELKLTADADGKAVLLSNQRITPRKLTTTLTIKALK